MLRRNKKLIGLIAACSIIYSALPIIVKADSIILGVNFTSMNFGTPTRISGTDKELGAVYKYSKVVTKDGISVDAMVTIQEKNNATLKVVDGTTNPSRFEPEISTGTGGGYINFKFEFFQSGTSNPVLLKDFNLQAQILMEVVREIVNIKKCLAILVI